MTTRPRPDTASEAIIRLSTLSTDDLYDRLAAVNAERAAIREVLRLRRAREREIARQRGEPHR